MLSDKGMICDYGCGQEAKYQFKNGKLCCESHYSKCRNMSIKTSNRNKGLIPWNKNLTGCYNDKFIEKLRISHLGKKDSIETKNKKRKASTGRTHTLETKNKLRKINIGRKLKEETKEKIRQKIKSLWNDKNSIYHTNNWLENQKTNKRTIESIKEKYLFFSQIEKMRYNPDKPDEKEIQVHCKYKKCINSKEYGGWFTPSGRQLEMRISKLENEGRDISNFYCSTECKQFCSIFYQHKYPKYYKPNNLREIQFELRQLRLEFDNYTCQICGETNVEFHCHHIEGIRWEPLQSADLDRVITLCQCCHIEVHKKEGCTYQDMMCKD